MTAPSNSTPSALRRLGIALLEATLGPDRLIDLAGHSHRVLIIRVPDKAWLTPLHEAAEQFLPEVRPLSIIRRDRDDADRLASLYLEAGPSSLWLTHDPELLPPVIRLAADEVLSLAPITTALLGPVIAGSTGRVPRRLRPTDHAGLGLFEIAAAIRPDTTAAQCVTRLRHMARRQAEAGIHHPDPDLLALPIVGVAARDWASGVVSAFAAIRAGTANASLLRHTVLHGTPGTGKSLLARAAAAKAGVPVLEASIPGFFSGSDGHLNTVLSGVNGFIDRLIASAPAIGVLDEVDAISARSAQREYQAYWTNLVDGLLLAIDRLNASGAAVLLVATTNLLSHVDQAIVRPGRLGHHILIEPPTRTEDIGALLRHHLERQAPTLKLSDAALAPLVRALIGRTPARIADIVSAACGAATLARHSPDLADLWKAMPQGPDTRDGDGAALAVTARHEAAHAVLALHLGRHLISMSLIRDGDRIGHTLIAALDRPATLADLEAEVTILLGGRAMDRLAGPGLCAGAADDLERALTLIGLGYTRWGLHALPLSMPGETIAQRCARDPTLAAAIDADLARLQQQADHLVSTLAEPIAGLAAALLAERHLDAGRIHTILEPFDVTDPTEPQP